jgi:hypothetical protein
MIVLPAGHRRRIGGPADTGPDGGGMQRSGRMMITIRLRRMMPA